MTRRIAITILLTVWAAIFVAGATVWVSTWFSLRHELDTRVVEIAKAAARDSSLATIQSKASSIDERVVLTDSRGQRFSSRMGGALADPLVTSRRFTSDAGEYYRQLELEFPELGLRGMAELPADHFFYTMEALAGALILCGIVAGAAAAIVARRIAGIALRPLTHTAEVIGTIDESKLDRRIEGEALPIELRPMAGRLNELLERLGRAFEQRRRFLADASHELRTPVAALITIMEVALRRPRPAAELVETMQTCLSEARHMRQLVQALLRQVRADGSANEEETQTMDAGEMLKECADLAGSLAVEREVSVIRSVRGKIPVRAEPGRLRSVVLNLMSNAIEYNHPGGTVELSAQSDDHSTEIVVKDDGPGISPEHLPNLFQPFYRATGSREADGHLGLGLFLVDSHVKAMGGECRVESKLGSGTVFRIRLPAICEAANANGGS
jgi:signal transduction histidine kinase